MEQTMQKPTRRLFLDLDGVLGDFDAHFLSLFKHESKGTPDEVLWAKINSSPSFFYDLPLCYGALDWFDSLWLYQPIILTACPRSNYHNVARQKKAWVKDRLGYDGLVLPVMGGANKGMFLQNEGDILVDDMERNCKAWEAEGGVAILHTSTMSSDWKLKLYFDDMGK
jgi:5'-nucleotidase